MTKHGLPFLFSYNNGGYQFFIESRRLLNSAHVIAVAMATFRLSAV